MAGSSNMDEFASDRGEMVSKCPIMEDKDLDREIREIFGDYARKLKQYGDEETDVRPTFCPKSTNNVCIDPGSMTLQINLCN